MPDEPVTEQRPLRLRHEGHQFRLDFLRRLLFCQAQPLRQPRDVGVHDDADIDSEGIAQNNVGRLAPDAIQLRQLLHRAWHFTAVTDDEFVTTSPDVLRLVAEKAGGFDGLLQPGKRRIRVIRRRTVFFEQLLRDNVDTFVGALRGKDGGDEQFERVGVIQLAMRFGIGPVQRGDDFFQARGSGLGCFA